MRALKGIIYLLILILAQACANLQRLEHPQFQESYKDFDPISEYHSVFFEGFESMALEDVAISMTYMPVVNRDLRLWVFGQDHDSTWFLSFPRDMCASKIESAYSTGLRRVSLRGTFSCAYIGPRDPEYRCFVSSVSKCDLF